MTDKNTVDAIVAGATASRSQLASLDHMLQGAIDKIVLDAAKQGRELTDDEKNQRKLLRGQQADVQEAFAALAFATAARLDNSDDVKQFREELQSINANLSDDLERLKKITTYAAIAVQVADGLAKLAAQVAGAVAKV
jgi:predicted  nucleic acid-binding Zn-ribbon protein